MAARRAGVPRLAFIKTGVPVEPRQADFAAEVQAYADGLFRSTFAEVPELLVAVTKALNNSNVIALPRLEYRRLEAPVQLIWRQDRPTSATRNERDVATHVVPVDAPPPTRRELTEVADTLPARLRNAGLVAPTEGIDLSVDNDGVQVLFPRPQRRYGQVDPGSVLGVRQRC